MPVFTVNLAIGWTSGGGPATRAVAEAGISSQAQGSGGGPSPGGNFIALNSGAGVVALNSGAGNVKLNSSS